MALSDYGTLRFLLQPAFETGFADGATVTSLTDRSGNGRTFTAEGSPIKRNAGIDVAQPSVYMDNGQRFVRSEADLFNNGGFTAIIAMRVASIPAANAFIFDTAADSADSRKPLQITTTGALNFSLDGGGGSLISAAGVIKANRTHVVGLTVRGAGSTLSVDGVQVASATVSTTLGSVSPMRIGSRFTGDTGYARAFYLGTFVLYVAPLSSANERAATEEVWATRWLAAGANAPMVMG